MKNSIFGKGLFVMYRNIHDKPRHDSTHRADSDKTAENNNRRTEQSTCSSVCSCDLDARVAKLTASDAEKAEIVRRGEGWLSLGMPNYKNMGKGFGKNGKKNPLYGNVAGLHEHEQLSILRALATLAPAS